MANQSNNEWLNDYEKASCVSSFRRSETVNDPKHNQTLYKYIDHRTTCTGSVVLSFESLDKKHAVVKFFNVSIKGKTKNYPAGIRGQFNPPRLGNFRKFWMECVGKPPDRWCRIHKTMRSTLKNLIFSGIPIDVVDKSGNQYLKLKEVSLYKLGTELAQSGHN